MSLSGVYQLEASVVAPRRSLPRSEQWLANHVNPREHTLTDDSPTGLPVMLTATEASSLLNVSVRTLLTHQAEWGLHALRLGKSYQFMESEIVGLLDGTL